MSPQQLKDYGQSLIAAITFSSNFYFLLKLTIGRNLLNLYLFYTRALPSKNDTSYSQYFCIFYGGLQKPNFLDIPRIISDQFVISEWGSNNHPSELYIPLTRAWELFLG